VADILIVEDDTEMARLMRTMLMPDNHQIRVVGDGEAALEAAAAGPVDLMLLDVNIPGPNGIEVCRMVRQAETGDRRATIVMLTGRHDTASKLVAFGVGADDYLVKPIDAPELRTRVGRWLEARQHQADVVGRRRREAIREIVAAVAHELNNPLAVAVIGVDLVIRRGRLDPEAEKDLGTVRDNLQRISELISSLQSVEDRTVSYVGSERMIDIPRTSHSE
jgi:DNA-binding response OmpR family regulator